MYYIDLQPFKDFMTARNLVPELKEQVRRVKKLHERDLCQGFGEVWLPGALDKKYPNAPRELKWQYVFPARNLSVDPRSGKTRRHHISEKVMQAELKQAVQAAEIHKHVTVHTEWKRTPHRNGVDPRERAPLRRGVTSGSGYVVRNIRTATTGRMPMLRWRIRWRR